MLLGADRKGLRPVFLFLLVFLPYKRYNKEKV